MPARDDDGARPGWRIALAAVHVAFMVANVSALVTAFWQRTHVEPTWFRGGLVYDWGISSEQIDAVLFMDAWSTLGRLSLVAAGLSLAVRIADGDRGVPRTYAWYGAALLAFDALQRQAQIQAWDAPRGTAPASPAWPMVAHAAAMTGWVVYVSFSKRVRATFVHEPRALGRLGRPLVGAGALALIAWPFVLNSLADASSVVAARLSPRTLTAGEGFAEGILGASAAIGLFVLLKHVLRTRNAWMTVLLPLCFGALVCVYKAQSFSLHWTF